MSRLQRGLNGSMGGGNNNAAGGNSSITRSSLTSSTLDRNINSGKNFDDLKRLIHSKLVDKLDLSRVSDLQGDTLRREIRLVVERLCDTENPLLNRMERERLIDEVLDEAKVNPQQRATIYAARDRVYTAFENTSAAP